jgi:signal transduction histidine kinase
MFRRVPNGDGSEAGSGMGLAIVKRIVETHGGEVWVDSTPDAGSVFRVRLPAM